MKSTIWNIVLVYGLILFTVNFTKLVYIIIEGQ